ncbi:hypothetical protein L202_08137 [Cryptococcus amylolentus CBS 6039]|uniref:Uncharacterized protein n=1 Tax=Cryptococcus amylolentus CBS 6039 TaxID=1295533 RepID=A0A1E3H8N7_9TREE|nr:hypothetical protein L202_08137 [Cryptococcus amylolentus CBS 6039]ODN72698.1 hypothetical protein L202_08137 [Cryptococcus amylolentus CBS 6039]
MRALSGLSDRSVSPPSPSRVFLSRDEASGGWKVTSSTEARGGSSSHPAQIGRSGTGALSTTTVRTYGKNCPLPYGPQPPHRSPPRLELEKGLSALEMGSLE